MPSDEIKKEIDFSGFSFGELCAINDFGGDPRLYETLTSIFTHPKDEDDELTN